MKTHYQKIGTLFLFLFIVQNYFGQTWSPLGLGIDTISWARVNAITEYKNNLFVGGDFFNAGGGTAQGALVEWDGNNWNTVIGGTTPGNYMGATVNAMIVYNNELIIGGTFNKVGWCYNLVKWNGTNWSKMGDGGLGGDGNTWYTSYRGTVYSFAIYNNELYAAGIFDIADNDSVHNIAKWNNSQSKWVTVGGGINGTVSSLAVYNGNLYAAGTFTKAGGTVACLNIGKWNGSSWSAVGGGITFGGLALGTQVNVLKVYNSELYAGGFFSEAGAASAVGNIARWDGTKWSTLGSGMDSYVWALEEYNNELYVGGWFANAGGSAVSKIARWDGTTWQGVGSGVDRNVYSFGNWKNNLYVGGEFANAGGVSASKIAEWSIVGAGIGEEKNSDAFFAYPNPANDFLNIELSDLSLGAEKIYLTDISGRTLYQSNFGGGIKSESINVRNLASGMYILQLKTTNEETVSRKKIIVTH